MLIILLFVLSIFVLFVFPYVYTFFIPHIPDFVHFGILDIYLYFKHKKYNVCREWGNIRLNCATGSQVFGCGKTLLLVMRANYIYKRYNDKLIFDIDSNCYVKQKIHIISNVELYNVPYIKFESINQLIDIDKMGFNDYDVTIFLLDESGAIFNSRQFRDNISPEFLTRLLQSRKHKVALYMTSQRFQFTDKILREVCSEVTTCRKWWRIIKSCDFDAYALENALNPNLILPKRINFTFCKDSDYHSYNSYQLVEDLRKKYNPDDYLNTKEILDTYGFSDGIQYVDSRFFKRSRRKGKKEKVS